MGEKPDPQTLLFQGAAAVGISLKPAQVEQFLLYLDLLLAWTPRLGLSARTTPGEIVAYHFLDALLVLRGADFPSGCRTIDVGSGAGFPGAPLAIVRPDLQVTLLEANRRRVAFLEQLVWALEIPVQVIWGRAEGLAHDPAWRERFDRAVCRAVAPLRVLVELCLPFLAVGGKGVFLKGRRAYEEVEEARGALIEVGGGAPEVIRVELPGTDLQRLIVTVPKVGPTPPKYPRRPGVPSRRPL